MHQLLEDQDVRDGIIFIGQTLGPFHLQDPKTGNAAPAFEAIKALDVDAAAEAWPFGEASAVREALSAMKQGLEDGIDSDAVVWEYRRLYIGPAPKPAPPWGSVYTDRECVVFGESTLALRQWMRECGIERLQDEKTPEDHIGLLLLLMAWLADEKPECLEDFLRLHLLTWSSHFLTQQSEAADQPFYQGLADLTKASLEGIQETLELSVEYPRFYR